MLHFKCYNYLKDASSLFLAFYIFLTQSVDKGRGVYLVCIYFQQYNINVISFQILLEANSLVFLMVTSYDRISRERSKQKSLGRWWF